MPLEKHAYLNAILDAAQESIASPESKLTLTSPAPGMSPSHQEMKDTSLPALICPNLKDGIEASNAQCLELLKNATIEKDEDVSYILFYSIFD